ncbi:MAG: GIY-YIG nuclease family protein, partial [Candidatus Tectomicrobia bacterium]|nr:GIY-YIG nuclease family protein [Candidatus Tectomicrobia bacterium]
MERPELKEKIESLPRASGVYLMKNQEGKVLYVGKAKDLRARVRSYFRPSGDSRLQVRFLVPNVADIDVIITDTEKEALILENNLIKQHRPRYNVNFRDDKDYVSLRIDLREEYPRLNIVRRPPNDGALYFGPYSS